MAELSLVRFDRDGLELFIDEATGRAYASIRATARMVGKDSSTIQRWVGVAKLELLKAEVQTPGGLQGAALLSSDQVFKAAIKYNPELAEKMGAAGSNVYMCGVAGYKVAVMTNQALERLEKQFLPTATPKEIKEAVSLARYVYGKAYAERYAAQMMQKHQPHLSFPTPRPEEFTSLTTAQALLTPTQVASEIGLFCRTNATAGDARRVNKLLESIGYQVRIDGQWSATEKAIAAGLCDRKPVSTDSRTQKDQLLWSAKVIGILKEHIVIPPMAA
jgi:hypothetical protein